MPFFFLIVSFLPAGTWGILRFDLALLLLEEEEEGEGLCRLAAPFTKPVTVQLTEEKK